MSILEKEIAVPSEPHRTPGLLSDFTWTLLGNGVFAACQWGIIVALAKLVTAEAVGQYSLSQAILGPVLMLVAFQLRAVVASDLKQQFASREYFAFRLLTLAAGLVAALALTIASYRSAFQVWMVAIVGLVQVADLTSDTLYGFHQRRGNLVRPAISMIVKGTIGLALLIAGTLWFHSVLAGLLGLFVIRAIVLATYDIRGALGKAVPGEGMFKALMSWRQHIGLFKVVFFIGVMAMLSSLIGMMPRYFVEGYLGSKALGIYGAISSLIAAGLMPVGALGIAAFVRLARAFVDGASGDFLRILGALLALSFVIGAGGVSAAYFAGSEILTLLFRGEYAAYTSLLQLTMIMGAVTFLAASLGASLTAARIYRSQAILLSFVAVTEAVLCWIIIPMKGLNGAMIACLGAGTVQLVGTAAILFLELARRVPQAAVATSGSAS